MSIRIHTPELRAAALTAILEKLAQMGGRARTSDLQGTKQFHGHRTLSSNQVIRLLRESDRVEEIPCGQGNRTWTEWWLKELYEAESARVNLRVTSTVGPVRQLFKNEEDGR